MADDDQEAPRGPKYTYVIEYTNGAGSRVEVAFSKRRYPLVPRDLVEPVTGLWLVIDEILKEPQPLAGGIQGKARARLAPPPAR